MNSYQREQAGGLAIVRDFLDRQKPEQIETLRHLAGDYFSFRKEMDSFLERYFSGTCTEKCYKNQRSACCGKDGIITFFADVALNALVCCPEEIEKLAFHIEQPESDKKCIYLSSKGCLWKLRPIVCVMFLCDNAKKEAFGKYPEAEKQWEILERQRKTFTWPDRPVLFDRVEKIFMDEGHRSSLMYLNISPGLLRVKKKAGIR